MKNRKIIIVFLVLLGLGSISCNGKKISPTNPSDSIFTLMNPFLLKWGSLGNGNSQFKGPRGIAVSKNNNIYVVDSGNSRVEKFDSNGSFILAFGGQGSQSGQLYLPLGVALDDSENVYVVDNGNYRIQVFNSVGGFIRGWGSQGGGNGQFNQPPYDISLDGASDVYVTDLLDNLVYKFDSNGNFIKTFGGSGNSNGFFNQPAGVVVNKIKNVLYVSDSLNHRIQEFDLNGTYLAQWKVPVGTVGSQDFRGINIDSDGNVYVVDSGNNVVSKLDQNGNYLYSWGAQGSADGQFYAPEEIVLDSAGNVYVTDGDNYRVEKFAFAHTYAIYPNPVSLGQFPQFSFNLNQPIKYSLKIQDSEFNTVFAYQGNGMIGHNQVTWDLKSNGTIISNGVYLVSFNAGNTQLLNYLSISR